MSNKKKIGISMLLTMLVACLIVVHAFLGFYQALRVFGLALALMFGGVWLTIALILTAGE